VSKHTNPGADAGVEFFHFDPTAEDLHLSDGRRITTEIITEAAATAKRTGPTAGLIPGGKSLSGGHQHSPQITVVLSDQTNAALRARAKEDRVSVSKWTRRLIERELTGA